MRWLDRFRSEDESRRGPLASLLEALALTGLSLLVGWWGLRLGGFTLRGMGAAQRDLEEGLRDAAAMDGFFTWSGLAAIALVLLGVFGALLGAAWAFATAWRWLTSGRSES